MHYGIPRKRRCIVAGEETLKVEADGGRPSGKGRRGARQQAIPSVLCDVILFEIVSPQAVFHLSAVYRRG